MNTEAATGNTALLHLLHLVSPALPVGAYAYSQGLESAVEAGWIRDVQDTENWLDNILHESIAQLEVPVLKRLYRAWQTDDVAEARRWNDFLLASRETGELLLEDTQMGQALWRLLSDLDLPAARRWDAGQSSFSTLFAMAASHYRINEADCLQGFVWSWLENQVQAAIKLVPLGQTQAQQLLVNLLPVIPPLCREADALTDEEIGNSLPRIAMASMQHETQYSRLFRS